MRLAAKSRAGRDSYPIVCGNLAHTKGVTTPGNAAGV